MREIRLYFVGKIGEAADALETATNSLDAFRTLQIAEEASIATRLERLREEVTFINRREREAQELYRERKDELDWNYSYSKELPQLQLRRVYSLPGPYSVGAQAEVCQWTRDEVKKPKLVQEEEKLQLIEEDFVL